MPFNSISRSTHFFSRLSFQTKIRGLVSILVVVSILFTSALLLQQRQIVVNGAEILIQANDQMVASIHMREILTEIDRQVRNDILPTHEIARFKRQLEEIRSLRLSRDAKVEVESIDSTFDEYNAVLNSAEILAFDQKAKRLYDDLIAKMGAFLEIQKSANYSMINTFRLRQVESMKIAGLFLAAFILLVMVAGSVLVWLIVHPLSVFVRFIDNVDLEKSSLPEFPQFQLEMPELRMLENSFEKLWERLQGFRALNIQRLLFEKRRADVIAATITSGIFLLRDGEVIWANPVGKKILEVSSDLGDRPFPIPTNPSGQALSLAISQAMPVELEVEFDGEKYFYLVRAQRISEGVLEEVESGLMPQHRVLLGSMRADQLVLAEDVTLVKQSQDAKSHFLATLSHEVKTPVTSLTLAIRLLKGAIDQIPGDIHKNLIITSSEEVDRLRVLIKDLLTVSSFDTLTAKLEFQNVDMMKLIKQTVRSFKPEAESKGISLDFNFPSLFQPVFADVDPAKILWALSNLVSNAIRHTPQAGKIGIWIQNRENFFEVRVKDSGSGIDPKRRKKIFEKFSATYDIRIARTGGPGMGLAIAREIITAHGGRIWVSNDINQGAEFCFEIPIVRREQEKMTRPEEGFHGTTARGG